MAGKLSTQRSKGRTCLPQISTLLCPLDTTGTASSCADMAFCTLRLLGQNSTYVYTPDRTLRPNCKSLRMPKFTKPLFIRRIGPGTRPRGIGYNTHTRFSQKRTSTLVITTLHIPTENFTKHARGVRSFRRSEQLKPHFNTINCQTQHPLSQPGNTSHKRNCNTR